jgi:hypothetical protein
LGFPPDHHEINVAQFIGVYFEKVSNPRPRFDFPSDIIVQR